jgi:hypothetical protein
VDGGSSAAGPKGKESVRKEKGIGGEDKMEEIGVMKNMTKRWKRIG